MFLKEVQRGIEGRNKGLNCGLKRLNKFINGIQKKTYYLIGASPKFGKCLGKGTEIVMYDGSLKKVEDVKSGDLLMGVDSSPRKVLSTVVGEEVLYKINQNKANSYTVNESHILSLKNNNGEIQNISVKECISKPKSFFKEWKGYKERIDFKEKELDIDPYLFGLWLGDGCRNKPLITTTDKEIIDYLIDYCNKNDYELLQQTEEISYYISDSRKVLQLYNNKIIGEFKTVDAAANFVNRSSTNISHACLNGNKVSIFNWKYKYVEKDRFYKKIKKYLKKDKYIPTEYLQNSIKNRLQLLAGIIDTDGYLEKKYKSSYEIIQKSKKITEGIEFLSNSLGFNTKIVEKIATMKRKDGSIYKCLVYRIRISGNNLVDIPVKVTRKKVIPVKKNKNSIINIEKLNVGNYYGFTLDKDGLFLLKDFTVTHNTAFADCIFVLYPYLLNKEARIKWIYYSYEIDLIEKMAKYCAFFMDYKYHVYCDSNYILGRGDNKVNPEHFELIKKIYNEELKDLFGEYDDNGRLIKEGKIIFFEDKSNPDAIRKYLMKYAEENGEFITRKFNIKDDDGNIKEVEQKIGYKEKDEDLYTFIIVDHLALCSRIRGLTLKENIDRLSQYMVFFRNICKFSPVLISQFNRELGKIERLKFSGEQLQPTLEDFRDSSDPSQDASLVIGMFNPTILPHLRTHMGYDLTRIGKSYRSLHILASRNTESGVSMSLLMEGKTGMFRELPKYDDTERLNEVYEYVKKFN